jgi:hypothetical protein
MRPERPGLADARFAGARVFSEKPPRVSKNALGFRSFDESCGKPFVPWLRRSRCCRSVLVVRGGAPAESEPRARAGRKKPETDFVPASRFNPLESITFHDFGSIRSKVIVI